MKFLSNALPILASVGLFAWAVIMALVILVMPSSPDATKLMAFATFGFMLWVAFIATIQHFVNLHELKSIKRAKGGRVA